MTFWVWVAEIFIRDIQHSETLTFLFIGVFVVHLMGPANAYEVFVVCVAEYLKTLVNKNVVYKEVCKAVKRNSQS